MRVGLVDYLDPDDTGTQMRAEVIELGGPADQVNRPPPLHPQPLRRGRQDLAKGWLLSPAVDGRTQGTRSRPLNCASVAKFISYIHNLIKGNAFDDSVMQLLIDRATITLLGFYFKPWETARRNPIDDDHWTTDWDVATIIQALEVHFSLRTDTWPRVRDGSRSWSNQGRICPIPYLNNYEILKDLSRCFIRQSSRDEQVERPVSAQPQCHDPRGQRVLYVPNSGKALRGGSPHHASMGGADGGEQPHGRTHTHRNLIHHQQGKGCEDSKRRIGQCGKFQCCDG